MSEWISTKERMPEEQGRYAVVYLKAGKFPTAFIGDFFLPEGVFSTAAPGEITHWAPLPALPETT